MGWFGDYWLHSFSFGDFVLLWMRSLVFDTTKLNRRSAENNPPNQSNPPDIICVTKFHLPRSAMGVIQ